MPSDFKIVSGLTNENHVLFYLFSLIIQSEVNKPNLDLQIMQYNTTKPLIFKDVRLLISSRNEINKQ